MKIRAILLFMMIIWDSSLHWFQLLDKADLHPLYPNFPIWGISYDVFWTIFWTLGALLMLTLLGSGTTIKTKTIINNYIPEEKVKNE